MYYPRAAKESWLDASGQFPVLLLTGPRQVGKTTFLQHVREGGRRYVTLDDPSLRVLAAEDPVLFLQRFPPPVLIDEIQYAPQLLPIIKMAVDRERRPGAFWLTGSQQFALMRGVSETLAGRIAVLNLLGFSQRERQRGELSVPPFMPVKDVLDERARSACRGGLKRVYRDIWLGGFPALAGGAIRDRDLFYRSYVQTYLERDVRDLAQVGNQAAFLRFLKASAARTGQRLNLTDLARDADVSVNTAKSWLSILQASFQLFLLPAYHGNLTKRLVKTPKLYFLDTGLCAYLAEWSSAETLEAGAMSGAIFETYVVTEVLKSWWSRGRSPQLYYCRDLDGTEIDLLFMQDRTAYPLEIKKSAAVNRDWLRPLAAVESLKTKGGEGGVVCLCDELLPLAEGRHAIPVGLI